MGGQPEGCSSCGQGSQKRGELEGWKGRCWRGALQAGFCAEWINAVKISRGNERLVLIAWSSINTAAEATDVSFNRVDHIFWDSIPFVSLSLMLCLHYSAAMSFLHFYCRSSPASAAPLWLAAAAGGGVELAAVPVSRQREHCLAAKNKLKTPVND